MKITWARFGLVVNALALALDVALNSWVWAIVAATGTVICLYAVAVES